MKPERVSIVLPTYNGAKYIRQSIDSCLNQTYKNIELIVVDDGSTDRTPQIIQSYTDPRIKYLRHEKNKGLPRALNTGFAHATGSYLTWTSDDNLYAKEAIEKMLSFLKQKKGSFVYCDFYLLKNNNFSQRRLFRLPDRVNLGNSNHIRACFLYSRKVKDIIGDYDPEVLLSEDYDYWIRVSKKFSMYHLNEPLYYFRMHHDTLSYIKFFEIQIVSCLVRVKNDILDINRVTHLFIDLITDKTMRFFNLNINLARILFEKKIKIILRDFKRGKIGFKDAKLKLENIFIIFKPSGLSGISIKFANFENIQKEIISILDELYSKNNLPFAIKQLKKHAYSNVYCGIALRYYEFGEIKQFLIYFLKAIRLYPRLVLKEIFLNHFRKKILFHLRLYDPQKI